MPPYVLLWSLTSMPTGTGSFERTGLPIAMVDWSLARIGMFLLRLKPCYSIVSLDKSMAIDGI